jgi:O-antigen/teichoic acid export membrane protein
MIDRLLAVSVALTAAVFLADWIAGAASSSLFLAIGSAFFAGYAYRVHRLKRRLSRQHVKELLRTLRETA